MTWLWVLIAALSSGMIGHFEGYLMGSKIRNITQLMAQPDQWQRHPDKCTCGHVRNGHRDGKYHCRDSAGTRHGCTCVLFIGKLLNDPDKKPKKPKDLLNLEE